MGTAVTMDPDSQKVLDDARSTAVADLKGRFPDSMLAPPPPAQPGVNTHVTNSIGQNLADSQPQTLPPAEPGPAAQPVVDSSPPPAPTPASVPVTDENTVGHALWDSTKQLGSEVGNGLMRGAADVANTLGFAAAGANSLVRGDKDAAASNDKIFDFLKNHVSTAQEYWKADPKNTNAWASTAGNLVEGAAPMMLGAAAAPAVMSANATVKGGQDSIDRGEDTATASTLAAIQGVSMLGQNMVGFKDPGVVKRIAKWVGAGDAINAVSDIMTKYVLNNADYKAAAAKIDPLDPKQLAFNSLMQVAFAVLHSPGARKAVEDNPKAAEELNKNPQQGDPDIEVKPDEPAPTAQPVQEPPPLAPQPAAKPVVADTKPAAPVIADAPSAEPVSDLKAQVADMRDPATPRKGVYLSADNVAQLGPEGIKAVADGAVVTKDFDKKGGVLISENKSEQSKATRLRRTEPDMQKVLGKLTGAGDGKAPDQTHVVQGQTPEGAVATETAVAPHEVPAAVQAATDAGHTPVVTTPEAAVARRADLVANEPAPVPGEEAKPVEAAAPAPEPVAKPAEPVTTETSPEPVPENVEPKAGDRKVIQVAGKDTPVVVSGPEVDGKVPVRLVDEDGRVAKVSVNVPREAFGKAVHGTVKAAAEQADDEYKKQTRETDTAETIAKPKAEEAPAPAEHPLDAAAKLFDKENTPPAGAKFAGTVAEHATRVAGLARAVKDAVTSKDPDTGKLVVKDGIDPAVAAHALGAVKSVINVDQKSPEALAKNQGVGHSMLDAHAGALKQAIHNIVHPDDVTIPVKPVKQDLIKAKIIKAREAAAKPKDEPTVADKLKAKAAEPEKVKTAIKDVEDETKPKVYSQGDLTRMRNAAQRYVEAGHDDAEEAHANLERVVDEIHGPQRRQATNDILTLAREQRDAANESRRPQSMSDSVDESEFEGHHVSTKEVRGDFDLQNKTPLRELADKPETHALLRSLVKAKDEGKFVSTHRVLDELLKAAKDNPIQRSLLEKLREHSPDFPLRPTDRIYDTTTGAPASALVVGRHGGNAVQIQMGHTAGTLVHTMIHEITHAATAHELNMNPHGEFAANMNAHLAEATARADRMYGAGKWKAEGDMYGLRSVHEMAAEISSPKFQKWLVDSELHATPTEAPIPGVRGLYDRVAGSIAKFFGVKNPGSARLLRDLMTDVQHGMELQDAHNPSLRSTTAKDFLKQMGPEGQNRLLHGNSDPLGDEHMPGLDKALHQDLEREPAKLQHDDEHRAIVGDHANGVARLFRQAIRSGAVEAIRNNSRHLVAHDQLVRTALRRGVFGHSADPTNPLRNYDEQLQARNAIVGKLTHSADPIVNDRNRLSFADNKKLGQFQIDSQRTQIDPRIPKDEQPASVRGSKTFEGDYKDAMTRWNSPAMTPAMKSVFGREVDWNENANRQVRKAGVDVALDSYSDKDIPKAQRALLYSVTNPHEGFSELIGKGKMIDLGDRNDKLIDSLKDMSSTSEIEGPYLHLGRFGDHVVQVNPEGIKRFTSQAEANAYGAKIRGLSPNSKAKVDKVGDSWQVDYKAEYTSMHESAHDADQEVARLRAQGLDVGSHTGKILTPDTAGLTSGMQNIIAEAGRRLDRRTGPEAETDEMQAALKQSFLSLMAARSSYAGSKLARKNVGGVKPEEMGRSFATHAQSLAWNTGHLATIFRVGDALGKLREATKNPDVAQGIADQRGNVYRELTQRGAQEAKQAGSSIPFNSTIAKAGFVNYMTSLSHSLVYLTQNFTTTIPLAMTRFGVGKAGSSFAAAMNMISGPTFRETYRAALPWANGHNVDTIQSAIMKAVAKDPRFGKWAKGENSPLQQLIDRGTIHTSLSNQLATQAKGGSPFAGRVMEYARIMPSMADMFNRVSTGLAALELHNGDVYKAGDFVKETHMDYSNENKPLAFKALNGVWGGNSVTMFRTYSQGMAHLLYSHIYDAVRGDAEGGRSQALMTVAALMLGTSIFAGVQKGMGLEPLKSMMYAYHMLKGDSDEYYSFDNMTRRAVTKMVGEGKTADVINGGLPRAAGFDMSSRMGLSDLMLHDPPDFTSLDATGWGTFAASQLGAVPQMLFQKSDQLRNAMMSGRMDDWAKVVPVKAVNNLYDAYKAGSTGKVTAGGQPITAPSVSAAVTHAIGFRTAEEAKISEKQQTDSEYSQFTFAKKEALVKAYTKLGPAERRDFWQDKVVPFNNDNPGHRVTMQDMLLAQRKDMRSSRNAQGFQSRDPVQNELNDY